MTFAVITTGLLNYSFSMNSANNEELLTFSIRKAHGKAIGIGLGLLGTFLVVVASLVHWSLVQAFSGYDKQIAALSTAVESRFVGMDTAIRDIDLVVDQVDDKVSSVDSTIAVAEVKSTEVEGNVVKVREQVDEINSGLSDTTNKVESLKTILVVAFSNDPNIQRLLEDDRLSELLPVEFFGDEPTKGAALPESESSTVETRARKIDDRRDSIASRCSESKTSLADCFEKNLKKYELRFKR